MRARSWIAFLFVARLSYGAGSYRPLDHLWEGTRDIVNTQNAIMLGVGSLLTIGALSVDNSVRDYFAGQNRLGGLEVIGNFWGTGIPGAVIGAGMVGYGYFGDEDRELQAGEALLEGLAMTAVYTVVTKIAVNRMRPDPTQNVVFPSFPSGHTSVAFSTAASLMHLYGPSFGIPALAMGVWTGVSRLASDVHWLSDVIFGATLGYIVGYAYTIHHELRKAKSKVSFLPYYTSRNEFGFVLSLHD